MIFFHKESKWGGGGGGVGGGEIWGGEVDGETVEQAQINLPLQLLQSLQSWEQCINVQVMS